MEEGDKAVPVVNTRRVLVERLPAYREMRRLLKVWHARPKTRVTGLYNQLRELRGTPQDTVDWTNPDNWIAESVTSEDRELALPCTHTRPNNILKRVVYVAACFSRIRYYERSVLRVMVSD